MDKYHEIEEANVGHSVPASACQYGPYCGGLNLDDRAAQLRIKDFAWRVTEELTEATIALGEDDRTHFEEEMADALHFAVEMLILCGFDSTDFCPLQEAFQRFLGYDMNIRTQTYVVIENMGRACNRLKLKPWKSTPMVTDQAAFKSDMMTFFRSFVSLLYYSGFTAMSVTEMYLRKNKVNQFRIVSKY